MDSKQDYSLLLPIHSIIPKKINLTIAVATCQTTSHTIAVPNESTPIQLKVHIPSNIQATAVSIQEMKANTPIVNNINCYYYRNKDS